MSLALPDHVRHFIQSQYTLTLATAEGGQPWAAAVYYVSDANLDLYFISDAGTRHVREGLASGIVAAAIHGAHLPWTAICGVQLEGRLEPVAAPERTRVEALYLARFTDVAWLLRRGTDPDTQRMAAKFRTSGFYRITPTRLRFIDNTRGFARPEQFPG